MGASWFPAFGQFKTQPPGDRGGFHQFDPDRVAQHIREDGTQATSDVVDTVESDQRRPVSSVHRLVRA